MTAYTRRPPDEVGNDDLPILYVDESGSRKRTEQGDWYVFGGILTDSPDGVRKAVRKCLAIFYKGQKAELKSKRIKPQAREWLLDQLNKLPNTFVVVHAAFKPKTYDSLLNDHHKFYRVAFANLVKIVARAYNGPFHLITDGQHPASEYQHFENTVKLVSDYKVRTVNPVDSAVHHAVQAADIVAGTARHRLVDPQSQLGQTWNLIRPSVVQSADWAFPRAAYTLGELW